AGALKIEPLTDFPERLSPGAEVYLEGDIEPRRIVEANWSGRVPTLRLDDVNTREAAAALVGRYLELPARELPEGSYYWHQLQGLHVVDAAGTELGELVEVFRAGENEVYRVVGEHLELLIPALRSVVREIDLAAGRMVVEYDVEEVR
ncbi:MAG: ribosome maturation factor RimM, partial [Chloroflexota bacterium]|nr:ribosome maturation factor RimM [Chloroflexota bacterium]